MQKARGCAEQAHSAPTACRCTVSGTISLPSQGCFSPFPHGTGSLSVAEEYLALGDGPPGFPRGSTCPVVLGNAARKSLAFCLRDCHPLWCSFPEASARRMIYDFPGRPQPTQATPHNPLKTTPAGLASSGFGLFRVRSPLLTESRLLSLPQGTEMVHFPWFASTEL